MASKTSAESRIEIPQLRMARIEVRIQGLTPLITHRFSEDVMQKMADDQQGKAKVKKAPRNPQAEFEAACYRTPGGRYGFPAAGVKKAMVTAGQRFAGERGTELYGAFSIPVELLTLECSEPRMREDRVVLSGMSRTSSIAYRPEFMPWAATIPLTFNADFITADQLVNLLRLAGFSVGLGDWRVEKKGSFGQFEIASVETL